MLKKSCPMYEKSVNDYLHAACLAYSLNLKTVIMCSSKTSVKFYQATWHHTPKDSTPFVNDWFKMYLSTIKPF
jgi:hypothetical protein